MLADSKVTPNELPWLKSSTRTYKLSDKEGVFWRFATKYGCDTSFCGIRHTLDISCGAQRDTAHPIVYLGTLRGFPVSQSGLRGRFLLAVGELGISATRDIRRSCLGDVIHKYQTDHIVQDTLIARVPDKHFAICFLFCQNVTILAPNMKTVSFGCFSIIA